MDRDADGIRRTLDIVHEDVLAPEEADAADDEDRDRDQQLRCGQVVLVKQRGCRREREQHKAIPDGTGLEHARDMFVQIETLLTRTEYGQLSTV